MAATYGCNVEQRKHDDAIRTAIIYAVYGHEKNDYLKATILYDLKNNLCVFGNVVEI